MKFSIKRLFVASALAIGALAFAACGGGDEAPAAGFGAGAGDTAAVDAPPAGDMTGVFNKFTFTTQWHALGLDFVGQHEGLTGNFTVTPMDDAAYQTLVMTNLATGVNVPDAISLEVSFLRQFVESDFLMPLNHLLPYAQAAGTFQYALDLATDDAGNLRAMPIQATPGVFYFRRSIAIEVFGTDDPEVIQTYFSDIPTFLESSRRIYESTNGRVWPISGTGMLWNPFNFARSQPWNVDGNLVIDDMALEFMTVSDYFHSNGLHGEISNWSGGWFQAMNDDFVDAAGNSRQVFGYFLPSWGLAYVLMPNAPDTFGDWGMIDGPIPYSWGGTWFGVPANAPNPHLGVEFVRYATTDIDFLTRYASYGLPNAELALIDPTIPATLDVGPGDFISSSVVVDNISDLFYDTAAAAFLGGQNPFPIFNRVSQIIDGRNVQGTDEIIQAAFQDATSLYIEGEVDRQGAINIFLDSISIDVPGLNTAHYR